MEELNLTIIEPDYSRSDSAMYYNGKGILTFREIAVERLDLTESDERILFATLDSMIFISKKKKGDNLFGFNARNRNQKKKTYYITAIDLERKLPFVRGEYRLGESVTYNDHTWFKVERL